MTRYFAIAAVSLAALTGAASAMTNPAAELRGFVSPSVAATLDATTVKTIKNIIHSGDSENEKQQHVQSILLQAGRG
jgi:hypothetical protein